MPGEQETVLSQEETTPKPQAEEQQPPKPVVAQPEQRRHNYENATRRIMTRSMRNQMAEMSRGLTEEEIQQVAKNAMQSMGFDPNDKDNEKQMQVFSKMQANIEALKASKIKEARGQNVKLASASLTETLKEIGIDPHSFEGRTIGQHLFNRYDVDDPDIFRDKALVEQEIEELTASLSKKKNTNPVTQAIINKAATPPRTNESRSPDAAVVKQKDDEAYANRLGVSKTKAAKIRQLADKLPAWMK